MPKKQMRGQPKGVDPDAFALQLDNAVNPFVPEHFKAADIVGKSDCQAFGLLGSDSMLAAALSVDEAQVCSFGSASRF